MQVSPREVTIARATPKQLYAITVLTRKYFPYTGFSMQAIQERMREKDIQYYAALYHGHTVGFVDFQFVGNRSKILGLAVLPEFRGNGIGKRLMNKALSEARKAHKKEAFLLTSRTMYPEAQAMYEKFGFKFKGKLAKKLWGEEIIIMSRRFRTRA